MIKIPAQVALSGRVGVRTPFTRGVVLCGTHGQFSNLCLAFGQVLPTDPRAYLVGSASYRPKGGKKQANATFRISICAFSGWLCRVCNRPGSGPGRRSEKWVRVRGGGRCLPFVGPRGGRVARKGPDPKTRDLGT